MRKLPLLIAISFSTRTDFDDSETDPSGWDYVDRENYTYDHQGHLTLYEEIEWEGVWVNSDREEYDMLSNGDVDSFIDFNWNETGQSWESSMKHEYTMMRTPPVKCFPCHGSSELIFRISSTTGCSAI